MISVQDLHKSFGAVKALDGVSFEIPRGQVVGLLGPNGAGKTTAMRILTGFVAPTLGSASVDDIDVQDDPVGCQRLIGYLPEGNPLYTDLRVNEALRFVADMHGLAGEERRRAIGEAVDAVGLTDFVHRAVGTLSKGYRQRVGLAQALLHRPPVLILDEPTTGLDPNQQQDMRDLIRELGRERTVILSTHILPEVEAVCQRALIISRGRLAADGTIEEIRALGRSGGHAYVTVRGGAEAARATLAALPFVRGIDSGLAGPGDGLVALTLTLAEEATPAVMERIGAALWQARLPVSRLEAAATRLEDVFAQLTQASLSTAADAPPTAS